MRFLADLLLVALLAVVLAAWVMLPWPGAIVLAVGIAAWLAFSRRGRQAASVAGVGISTLRQRLGASAVIVVGIAGVVGVLVALLAMVLAESLLLLLIGGVVGLLLAAALIPVLSAGSGGMLNLPGVGVDSWLLGIALMAAIGLVVGALPAWSAMRLNIVDALAGR